MSVFRTTNANSPQPRDPYPFNRESRAAPRADGDAAIPDGPTERIADRLSRRTWVALGAALLAVQLAGLALLLAWRAGRTARAAAEHPPPAAAPTVVETFPVSYAREPLRVQVGCSAVQYLDLDEPRSNVAEQASDLRYDSRCGDQPPRLTLGPGATAGAQVPSSDTDAAGCARAIRTSPLGPGASVDVRRGAVLCVQTAGPPARMVLVEITEVGRTGTAGMRATSWQVTG